MIYMQKIKYLGIGLVAVLLITLLPTCAADNTWMEERADKDGIYEDFFAYEKLYSFPPIKRYFERYVFEDVNVRTRNIRFGDYYEDSAYVMGCEDPWFEMSYEFEDYWYQFYNELGLGFLFINPTYWTPLEYNQYNNLPDQSFDLDGWIDQINQ